MINELPRHLTGCAVLLLAFGIVAGMFHWPIPEGNAEVALVVLGVAIGWAGSVVAFHFGTSEGSKRKTDLIASKRPEGDGYDEEKENL